MDCPIDRIRVENRYRKQIGDLGDLLESVALVGLLHPLVIDQNCRLIAGTRRLAAVRRLGWTHVPVTVCEAADDALRALEAERDENTCRRPLLPSEAVELGRAIEELEIPGAAERQRAGISQTKIREPAGKFPQGSRPGRIRDRVGQVIGMSGRTYQKAKAVVDAAMTDPSLAPLIDEMDASGKIDSAHRKLKRHKSERDSLEPVDDAGNSVPSNLVEIFTEVKLFDRARRKLREAATALQAVESSRSYRAVRRHGEGGDSRVYSSFCLTAAKLVEDLRPSRVCESCLGRGCERCGRRGWLITDEVMDGIES